MPEEAPFRLTLVHMTQLVTTDVVVPRQSEKKKKKKKKKKTAKQKQQRRSNSHAMTPTFPHAVGPWFRPLSVWV